MYSFRELSKAAKLPLDSKEVRVAVLGNCATQFFSMSIQGYARLSGMNLKVFDADYNQIDVQLINPESETYKFHPDAILLWISTEKIYEEFMGMSISKKLSFADLYIQKIEGYWNLIGKNSKARILQLNFTEIDDKALGNYSCKVESSFIYQIRKLNYLLECSMAQRSGVYPVDLLAVQIRLGLKQYYKAALYYNSKMPVATDAYPYIAKAVVDVLKAQEGQIKKCIICDLDNTLWGGTIGDDGLDGIEIGELGKGRAFADLQRWLKQLKEYGVILAVCSKNGEEAAKEPFEKHDEMILRLSDISVFVANWEDKVSNICRIREILNISMDSIVFLDDNAFERNLIRRMISDIEVPELPDDPALYLSFLQESNYFEAVSYTGENEDRTRLYQAEAERRKLSYVHETLDDYLKSLGMRGTAKPFEKDKFARIAQLTQRTNQFNLRTIRYTENDIKRIACDDDCITLYFTLKDEFGDYGVVSVVIIRKDGHGDGFIDTWLMSCRVFKRGMEEYVANHIVKAAKKHGLRNLKAEYIPTAKNRIVCSVYNDIGFEEIKEHHYQLSVDCYVAKKTYILEEEGYGER